MPASARFQLHQYLHRSDKIRWRRCLRPCKIFGLDRTKMFHVKHSWNNSNRAILLRLVGSRGSSRLPYRFFRHTRCKVSKDRIRPYGRDAARLRFEEEPTCPKSLPPRLIFALPHQSRSGAPRGKRLRYGLASSTTRLTDRRARRRRRYALSSGNCSPMGYTQSA